MLGKVALIFVFGLVVILSGLGRAAERLGAFGNGIPLALIDDMLPVEDIRIEIAEDVDRNIRIEWSDSDNWMLDFLEILEGKGLRAVVDSKSIVIERLDEAKPQTPEGHFDSQGVLPLDDEDILDSSWNSVEFDQSTLETPAVRESELKPISRRGFKIIPLRKDKGIEESGEGYSAVSKLPEPDPMPVAAVEKKSKYFVKSGDTLNATLERWASKDSWTIVWNPKHDYILEADAEFEGDFVSAVSEIVRALSDVSPQLTAEFYDGNRVLAVSSSMDEFVH